MLLENRPLSHDNTRVRHLFFLICNLVFDSKITLNFNFEFQSIQAQLRPNWGERKKKREEYKGKKKRKIGLISIKYSPIKPNKGERKYCHSPCLHHIIVNADTYLLLPWSVWHLPFPELYLHVWGPTFHEAISRDLRYINSSSY